MAKKKTTKGAAQVEEQIQVQETPEVSENVETKEAVETKAADSEESAEGGSEENSEASEESSSEENVEKKEAREPEVPGSITKFFKFETASARSFDLDGGFIKVIMEKRIRVKAFISEECQASFDEVFQSVEEKTRRMKNPSVDLTPAKVPGKGFFMIGRGYPITDIFVPLTKNSSRTIDKIKASLVSINQEMKGVTLRYKIETVARIIVDTSREHKNATIKGFVAGACTVSRNRRDENTIELIPEFRGQMFIDKQSEFSMRDVLNMNEIIEMNKVRLYTTTDERNKWDYYLPLSKMMAIAIYQVVGVTPKGKLKIQRTLARIRIRNVSVAGIVVPVGVFISMRKDVVSTKKLENFFVDVQAEGKNVSFLQTYGEMPINDLVEYSSLKQDFSVIDKVILDSLSEVEETPETPEPSKEETPTSKEEQEVNAETTSTEEEKSSEEESA